MQTAIKIIMLIVSILLIVTISLQESRSDGLSGVIGGGAEQLFGKKRSRGYDQILHRITIIGIILYFAASLAGIILGR